MKVNKEEHKPNLNSENAMENKEGKVLTRLTHTHSWEKYIEGLQYMALEDQGKMFYKQKIEI